MGCWIIAGIIVAASLLGMAIHNAWNFALLGFAAVFGFVSYGTLPPDSRATKTIWESPTETVTPSPSSYASNSNSTTRSSVVNPKDTPFDYDHLADSLFPTPTPGTHASSYSETSSPSSSGSTQITSSDGRTYWIPKRYIAELDEKQRKLENARTELDQLEKQLTTLSDQVVADRPNVKLSDHRAVARFNAKVDKFNATRERYRRDLKSFNASVAAYNSRLEAVGTSNP